MTEMARWNLTVAQETDVAVRTLLAERGGRKGDLSRFIEQAVLREVLFQTVDDVRARNRDVDPDELDQLIEEAVSDVRSKARENRTA